MKHFIRWQVYGMVYVLHFPFGVDDARSCMMQYPWCWGPVGYARKNLPSSVDSKLIKNHVSISTGYIYWKEKQTWLYYSFLIFSCQSSIELCSCNLYSYKLQLYKSNKFFIHYYCMISINIIINNKQITIMNMQFVK